MQYSRYNLLNNLLGWLCFLVAAVTYLLTMEPTASFWDCPEFVTQGYALEVGHPPGNPIFMLAARFFTNFAFGDVTRVALMVNAMSALFSAGTILLLFWTVTHLVRRLTVKDLADTVTVAQAIAIFGAGLCGALVYTWSDTFWFSATEAEVYSFSSFCTALVFWLILKWENRADNPASDKYLILIAYVIGISIAVHLLNLLCIPAIVLVIYYRKWKDTTARGSLLALAVSAVIVALILYGLVPGFIEIAQYFELFFVNVIGLGYNSGVIVYALLLVASFIWCLHALWQGRTTLQLRLAILSATLLSGIFFIGNSLLIPLLLMAGLAVLLWSFKRTFPFRVLTIAMLAIFVIFIGYSSYALLLIRSSANPPMNQNAPDNVFALASYLNREQYGDTPLLYGHTYDSGVTYLINRDGSYRAREVEGRPEYAKVVKSNPDDPDRYHLVGHRKDYVYTPELDMLFPRMHSSAHRQAYLEWTGMRPIPVNGTLAVDEDGNTLQTSPKQKPSFADNLRFFVTYQLNYMYWRYFMWNFAGRQNDIQGQGEVNHGNWISGIPIIDNPRLGDQSLLPYDEGEGNKGHNVFYMLPLLMGIIGLLWQAFVSKRGIEQFWVVFFLFFMTGIAIVLYLNQTPNQVRERDYAYAGSFYAYAIWVGMGVAGLTALFSRWLKEKKPVVTAAVAAAIGLFVPLQMVSQTWDDHDRSGRTTARDFGMNYLNSLEPNAIIFTNGDNDTFPLWYAQEVEGVRPDVKVVNLSYLTTDWYANMQHYPTHTAAGIPMLARPDDFAYNRLQFSYYPSNNDTTAVDALTMLGRLYSPGSSKNSWDLPMLTASRVTIPVDVQRALDTGHLTPEEAAMADTVMTTDLKALSATPEGMTLGNTLSLDMIATSMAAGMERPTYFAMTVPDEYYLGLSPYMQSTGLAYRVTPVRSNATDSYGIPADTERAYDNIVNRFRWGGLDTAAPGSLYLDETTRRMVTTVRTSLLSLAQTLLDEGYAARSLTERTDLREEERAHAADLATDRFTRARTVLTLLEEKLPATASPYSLQMPQELATAWHDLGQATGDTADVDHALQLITDEITKYARNIVYYQSLTPSQYATLQRADIYIDRQYLPTLLQYYVELGGSLDQMATTLDTLGVNLDRLFQFQ